LLERLRDSLLRPAACGLSDGDLLERFLVRREEAAFALLLRRHGPMVLGVCRRVLRQEQDAEDAFQATFLVLARRAAAVEPRERVGPWLYGVAYRTALKARALAARRREVERAAARPADIAEAAHRDHLRPLLDQYLSRLPDRYRVPLVLCDLQGRPRRDVARELGLPEGTLSSRLARARALLGRRLRPHGIALSAACVAAGLAGGASAAPPAALTAATAAAAVSLAAGQAAAVSPRILMLTEGVLRAMTLTRWKIATVVLLSLALMGGGGGLLTRRALADRPAKAAEAGKDDKEGKGKEEVGPTVNATVKAVDAGKHTLTATVGNKKEVQEKAYELAKDVRVTLNDGRTKGDKGKEGSLADLTPGLAVELRLAPGGKAVSAVTVRPWTLHAGVMSVDAAKRTIIVTTKSEDGPVEKTYTLVEGAKVLLNDGLTKGSKDQEGKLGDLTGGTPVQVRVSAVDPKTVLEVRPQGQVYFGELKGIDAAKSQITIAVKEDGQLVDKQMTLLKEARVLFSDGLTKEEMRKLTDLTEGTPVQVRMSVVDPKMVLEVRPEGQTYFGELKGIDADNNKITITVKEDGQWVDKELTLVKGARVSIDSDKGNREVKLEDLKAPSPVVVRLSVFDATKAAHVSVREDDK
jgi:RNA polymerase sigma factor (sigma-70 family)